MKSQHICTQNQTYFHKIKLIYTKLQVMIVHNSLKIQKAKVRQINFVSGKKMSKTQSVEQARPPVSLSRDKKSLI